jgi:sugar phosphate isomerase/epimerase
MIDIEKRTGISTACFYPMLLEDAFDVVCDKLEYKACELFLNTSSETKVKFLKNIKSKADGGGIKISAVHPYMSVIEPMFFFSEYKRRTIDSIELYCMFFEAAQFLGADYVILHGIGPNKLRGSVSEYAEKFLLIAEEAKKYGVELLHENIGSINGFIKELLKESPDIRFTLDFKHAISWGYDVLDIIEAMGNNIAHIHLNDMYIQDTGETVSKTEMCRLPFFGNINYSEIFKKLDSINYIGNFITEVYRYNYANESEIIESKKRFIDFMKL